MPTRHQAGSDQIDLNSLRKLLPATAGALGIPAIAGPADHGSVSRQPGFALCVIGRRQARAQRTPRPVAGVEPVLAPLPGQRGRTRV